MLSILSRARPVCLFLLVLSFCAPAASFSADKERSFVLAVIPSAPPVTTHTLWAPFVERLSAGSGLSFQLKVYERMSDFERDILQGTPDLLFASPLQAVVAHAAQGYEPLLRGGRPVSAELFVRKDSPVQTIADLSGKKVAFVGTKNF